MEEPLVKALPGEWQSKEIQEQTLNSVPEVRNLDNLKLYLSRKVNSFRAGSVKKFYRNWQVLTSDIEVLQSISGLGISINELPESNHSQLSLNDSQAKFVKTEIDKLLHKKVIVKCGHEPGEVVSPIFLTPKSDGGFRFILNLKKLNRNVEKIKFKMHTLSSILCLLRPGLFMAKLDIKDAYYSIPINVHDQKLLKFSFNGCLYMFTALPNGYTEGPRKFTKIMKPPLSTLRKSGVSVTDYIDDMLTMSTSVNSCYDNIDRIIQLLDSLGFVVHPEKSNFKPTQVIEFLGFVIDTFHMTIQLTQKKKRAIVELCNTVLSLPQKMTIRLISKVLGKMASSFVAVPFGRLYYRATERHKIWALKLSKGKYEAKIPPLPEEVICELVWWRDNIINSVSPISRGNPRHCLTTDASSTGWGHASKAVAQGGISGRRNWMTILMF